MKRNSAHFVRTCYVSCDVRVHKDTYLLRILLLGDPVITPRQYETHEHEYDEDNDPGDDPNIASQHGVDEDSIVDSTIQQSPQGSEQSTLEHNHVTDRPRHRNPRYPNDDQYGPHNLRRSQRIKQANGRP